MTREMLYAVILFASESPDCDLSHCPMSVHLFPDRQSVYTFMDSQPRWTQPHCLPISKEK